MNLYRAVSKEEFQDYLQHQCFRVSKNTLEAKQFFKTKAGVSEFVRDAIKQRYNPPYTYLFTVNVDPGCLKQIDYDEGELDRFEAITIHEEDLPTFNNCVKFVKHVSI